MYGRANKRSTGFKVPSGTGVSGGSRRAEGAAGEGDERILSKVRTGLLAPLLVWTLWPVGAAEPATDYLPLAVGMKWVLRSPHQAKPVVFEVLQQDGDGYRLRSTNPWGSSEWTLAYQAGKLLMTAYGTGGDMMPLADKPVYLDFTKPAGTKWSNSLGELTVVSRTAVVRSHGETYSDCVQIRHKARGGASLVFTFAKGVGYVQFGEGGSAFVLEKSESRLSGDATPPAAAAPAAIPRAPSSPPAKSAGRRHVFIGLTPNKFANETLTMESMMNHFQQTLDAGVTYVAGYGAWAELEPHDGRYNLDSLNQPVSIAASNGLPASFALRVINTVARDVPADLQSVSWSDARMRSRVLRLMDAMAPLMKGRVKWFTFGYEVDGYLAKHPDEVAGFTELYRMAASRIKELVPGLQVSCIVTYSGLGDLNGRLAELNRQLDFLAVTYSPTNPDFTVKEPAALPGDFTRIKKFAAGRKIVVQEIAYPTAASAGGSEEKQAEFYRLAFREIRSDPADFDAVNFMMFADLSDAQTDHFLNYYRFHTPSFRGLLQTLGMFDGQGRPKKGWEAFRSGAQALRSANE